MDISVSPRYGKKNLLHGNITVNKTGHTFSNISIDQALEQNNACVKADGGAISLTQNPAALWQWMVSGPEMAHLIEEFQESLEKPQNIDIMSRQKVYIWPFSMM